MVEVAEIAEDRTLLGEAFQKIVFDGGLVVLIFEYDDEHVVEMLWRRRGASPGGGVLCKGENRDGPKEKCFTCKSAAIPAPERHVSSRAQILAVLTLRRRPTLKGCTSFASSTSSVR